MPKLVYLDSSDFSNLSHPEPDLGEEDRAIISRLRQHKVAGTAIFFMSAIHLTEAVHAASAFKPAAVRRAQLMRELCGTNLLRFPIELPKLELRKALNREKSARLTIEELTSQRGEWFGLDSSLDSLADARRDLEKQIDTMLARLPRQERRKLKSELNLEKRSSHAKWREIIGAGTPLTNFPFSLITKRAAVDWFLGEMTDGEFRENVLSILRDPYALFCYLLDETRHREKFYELIRTQGRENAFDMENMIKAQFPALEAIAKLGHKINLSDLIDELCSKPDFLRKFVVGYADVSVDHIDDSEIPQVVAACPSLTTFIEASKTYLVAISAAHVMRIRARNESVKSINRSDFGDLMHCFYAPYFDVFRCDARFGALLKAQNSLRGRIADRIADLLVMLPDLASTPKISHAP